MKDCEFFRLLKMYDIELKTGIYRCISVSVQQNPSAVGNPFVVKNHPYFCGESGLTFGTQLVASYI